MTPVQVKALDFIRDHITATGVSPSYSEIADAISAGSKSYAHRIVEDLVEAGHLTRGRHGQRRSLSLPDVSLVTVPLPSLLAEMRRRGVSLA